LVARDLFVNVRLDQETMNRLDEIAQPFNRARILREALEAYLDRIDREEIRSARHSAVREVER
jgi:predicted transcriptional regulator